MGFQIEITDPALADSEDYVRFIRDIRKEPEAAARWFRGLVEAVYSLEELPERCPLIPEWSGFGFELRHLIYFSHRIIFRVYPNEGRVLVYRIYPGAKGAITTRDLEQDGDTRSDFIFPHSSTTSRSPLL